MKAEVPAAITVEDFQKEYASNIKLQLLAGTRGLKRPIEQGSVNRPGLALVGFYESFAHQRIQIIGNHETAYLNSLGSVELRARIARFLTQEIPCVIFARSLPPPPTFLEEAETYGVPVFSSPLITMRLVNAATIALETAFAPRTTEHCCMVDIQGVGVMIRGSSGIGKSEAALALIERGYSLVSDDICKITLVDGRELNGTSSDLTRYHMEVRGIGIINVLATFGVGSVRTEKRIDLVVTLAEWAEAVDIDRTGLDQQYYEILGVRVPHIIIPLRPGRDVARLIEVAALDAKLKLMGHHSALEFNKRLMETMQSKL
jgi:HPr kinase/phosphorylase